MSASTPRPPPGDRPPTEPETPEQRRRRGSLSTALVLEDFRSVRRWLIVLGAIAVVAAAVAAYALVKAYESEREAADAERVVRLERTLERRLDELRAALRRTGEEADIARLQRELRQRANAGVVARIDRRVGRLEDDVVDALDASADASRQVTRLTREVEQLSEREQR